MRARQHSMKTELVVLAMVVAEQVVEEQVAPYGHAEDLLEK